MSAQRKVFSGLSGNQLKIIAMIAMTCDHVGLQLFPRFGLLRIIGRLALPVYAYMIAEGCLHTHDRRRYLLRMASLALVCQVVYLVAMGSLYQCILVTFSLSICLIWGIESARKDRTLLSSVRAAALLLGIWAVCEILPGLLPGTDFAVDYGFFGVLLPVLVYFGKPRVLFLAGGLLLLALDLGGIQWWGLAAVPLLLCYNGTRGKRSLGRWFYIYYPAHLVVIYVLSLLI